MKVRDRRQELFDKSNPVLACKADDRAATAHCVTVGRTAGSNPATGDICSNRHKGNEQSTAAFHVIKDKISASQERILNAISGRCSELKRDGKIYKSGTRKTRSGCSAAILKAYP